MGAGGLAISVLPVATVRTHDHERLPIHVGCLSFLSVVFHSFPCASLALWLHLFLSTVFGALGNGIVWFFNTLSCHLQVQPVLPPFPIWMPFFFLA